MDPEIEAVRALEDPLKQAQQASELLTRYQAAVNQLSRIRREAIEQLIAMTDGAADIIAVKVPGLPGPGVRQGHPVKVHGLVAQPWTMNDRSGVAFRAARIEPAVPAAKAS